MRPQGLICMETKEYENGGYFGKRCIQHLIQQGGPEFYE